MKLVGVLCVLLAPLIVGCEEYQASPPPAQLQFCPCAPNETICGEYEELITRWHKPEGCANVCEVQECESIDRIYRPNLTAERQQEKERIAGLEKSPWIVCENMTPGTAWECHANEYWIDNGNLTWQYAEQMLNKIGDICSQQGGKFHCGDRCWSTDPHYCDQPFPDAGKYCSATSQCRGFCEWEYSPAKCTWNCHGNCSEHPLRGSYDVYEVLNSTHIGRKRQDNHPTYLI